MIFDFNDRASARDFMRVWPSALIWIGVISWSLIQAGPTPTENWAHSSWLGANIYPGSISADPEATYHGALRLLAYLAIFWIAACEAREPSQAIFLIKLISAWSIILAIFGLFTIIVENNFIIGDLESTNVVTATFVGKNLYVLHASMGLYCCISILILNINDSNRKYGNNIRVFRSLLNDCINGYWIYWLGLLIIFTAIIYTSSRAGIISAMIGLIILIRLSIYYKYKYKRNILIIFIIILFSAVSVSGGNIINSILYIDLSKEIRSDIYIKTIEAIGENPWQGYGLGSFREAFRIYVPDGLPPLEFDFAHNSYLENAFELGVPASLAFYLALGLIFFQICRGVTQRRRRRIFPAIALATLTAGGLHSLVDFSLQMPATAGVAALLFGVAWSQSIRKRPVET